MVKKLTFLSNRHIKLNFRPSYRAYFYLWNDSLWVKIEVKMDEISPKYQNSNKSSLFSKTNMQFLGHFCAINCIDWAGTEVILLNHLKEKGLDYFS